MRPFPILDNHLHLQSHGRTFEAVKEFERAGGTHVVLCHLPHKELVINSADDFLESFEVTLRLADIVRENTNVTVFTTVGPYPVEYIRLSERYGPERAEVMMMKGMEHAARLVEEGRAMALGEIGRPHFPVDADIVEACNRVLLYGMELARDVGCAVVLHTETGTPEVMRELAEMADRAGLAREKVVKHYSPPIVRREENHGLFPSVLATNKAIREALSHGDRFMMETDFLDDPRRPGAVLGPKTVPKRTMSLIEEGLLTGETAHRIHKDNPERVYGIDMEM